MKHIKNLKLYIMPELVFISLFVIIFGIFYLHYSTRNKERLSLIEKGADASIFFSAKAPQSKRSVPIWKILILNLALLLIGIGSGIFLASILDAYTVINDEVAYTGSVFLMAGVGLYVGFIQSKKLVKKE
jgi:flagellar biosynthesis protein FliQ